MPIAAGDRLGRYEIVSLLGKGGMGEVYLARDTRLGRDVAIKTAHERFNDRFETEARAIAQLNHRNVCTIYDVGPDYLVMECVAGETLAARLKRGEMTPEAAVNIAIQIAEGLNAAHARGVLHRDLKPANIMITPEGEVKIMDFGLAKLAEVSPVTDGGETVPMTAPGQVMGTPEYLAPEQIRGEPTDGRADIWALGVTLYEMLTGARPFRSTSTRSIVRSILEDAPPSPSSVRPVTPKGLDAIVRKAMAKDADDRYQSSGELLDELRPWKAGRGRQRGPWLVIAAAIVAVSIGAGLWLTLRYRAATESAGAKRPTLEQMTAFADGAAWPAVSSDGKLLAFIRGPGTWGSLGQVYVKMLPNGEPVAVTHDNARRLQPEFSPDGSRVSYTVVDGGLWDTWTVPVLGGAPRLWMKNVSGIAWLGSDRIVFSEIRTGIHMAVVTAAAESRTGQRDVYDPPTATGMAHQSRVSPDGKWVALIEMDARGWLPCRVVPMDGSTRGTVIGPATGGCSSVGWSPDGRFVYTNSSASGQPQIWRQRFPDGKPEEVTFGPAEASGIAVAPDGSVVTSIGLSQGSIWLRENGEDRQVSGEGDAALPESNEFPSSAFSPDGSTFYYLLAGGLWAANLRTGANEAVLPGKAVRSYDVSPDGSEIVYSAMEPDRRMKIWLTRSDGREPPRQIASMEAYGPAFGPGRTIYFAGFEGGASYIFRTDLATGVTGKFLPESEVFAPTVSPDRKWLVVTTPSEGGGTSGPATAYPVQSGDPVKLCQRCFASWSRDASTIYFSVAAEMGALKTLAVPLRRGQMFPKLPPGGFTTLGEGQALPGARLIERQPVYPGTTAGVYAYVVHTEHRNLYRVRFP